MDILLVNPWHNGRAEIPPLGLQCLAGSLMNDGIEAVILDLDVWPKEDVEGILEETLGNSRPRILGVGALSDSFTSAMETCVLAKSLNADILTVLGGMHATVLDVQVLEEHPQVDIVVRGEGEKTFLELVRRFLDSGDCKGVDGISYRDGKDVVRNQDRELEKNLDRFPLPERSPQDVSRYRTQSVSSSRGCRRNCSFCSIQSQYRHTVRVRSPESLMREIGELVSLGARRIMFTDDNFTFSLERVRGICKSIIERGFDRCVEFYAEGCLEDICKNPLIAQILGQSGFRALYAGAESGSPKILARYGKNLSPVDVLKGASYCLEQNVMPVLNFILLGPWDTVDTIRQTIDLAKQSFENGAEIAYAEMLIPYPGTPVQEELVRDGKFRQRDNVFYFESYEGISVEWFLRTCDLARDITWHTRGTERLFGMRKAYHELTCLRSLLEGDIPVGLRDCSGVRETEYLERKIEDWFLLTKDLMEGIIPV